MSAERPELIDVSEENARRIQELLAEDFKRLDGITEDDVLQIADPHSGKHVARQLSNLNQMPEQYYGLTVEGVLHGVGRIGEWLFRDEAPFVGHGRTLANRTLHILRRQIDMVRRDNFEVLTGGLHAFALSDEANPVYAEEFFSGLVTTAQALGYRSLKSAVDLDDDRLRASFSKYPAKGQPRMLGTVEIKTAGERSARRSSILKHISISRQ